MLAHSYLKQFFLLILALFVFGQVQAEINNINIRSNSQELQQLGENNLRSTFSGGVVIVYNNTTKIVADRVIVTDNNGRRHIVAYGKNVVVTNQERNFRLETPELQFDVVTEDIIAKNAIVNLNGNSLSGNLITYNTKTGNIQAKGGVNTQVKTIINTQSK